MIKIFKYLKSSIFSCIAIIFLLVIQASLDLALPDYTSKIVNVGIQQSGISNAAIEEIGENSYNKLLLFMNDEDKDYINSNYYKSDKTVNEEAIYKLKKTDDTDKISKVLAKPMTIISFFDEAQKSGAAVQSIDMPEGVDLYQLLISVNDIERKQIVDKIYEKIDYYPDTIVDQAAINYVKAEYNRIGVDVDKIQILYILKAGSIMVAIALLVMVDGILTVYIGSRMAAKLSKTLREKVFRKVVGFSKSEVKTLGQSSLITRTTNDIQQIQMVIVFLFRVVFYAPIIGIGGIIKALRTNSSMTYIIGLAILAILFVIITLFVIAMPKFTKIQKLIDKLNLVTREILSGLPVIRAFSNEKHEEKRFDEANLNLTKVNLFVNRVMSFMMPLMMLIMNFVSIALIYKGAIGVDNGSMQVGDIMAYIQYTMQIIMAFLMISMMSIMLPRANVSAKRVMEVLETKNTILNPKNPVDISDGSVNTIEFRNVSFRYPDADYDVMTDISFTAESGQTTAFIGSTGSGKSTLINLIPRFYDITSGEITIGGTNIKDLDIKKLRDRIGFVPQKGVLFTGTIIENIKYGNERITDEMVKKALSISQSSKFVSKLDGSENYQIAQGGTNVSGGQKQRLSIARAIAKDPDIFIFDDSFSALDFKTDAKLRAELAKVTKNKTVLIVAQRISTIMNADKIVVLHEGNVVGIGKHKELLKSCKVYREIAQSQLSKEELEYA